MKKYDVIIIGAGSAGLTALSEIHRATENFLLINDGPYGTTCARVGCMPSKALIEVASAYYRRNHFNDFGIHGGEGLRIDRKAVLQRVRKLRDSFVSPIVKSNERLGDKNIAGRAKIVGPNVVEVNKEQFQADKIVIAPGSKPVVPGAWRKFSNRILTTENLFEQSDLPDKIAVIGLGAIGCEMAQALSRLGVEVYGFDMLKKVAALSDEIVSDMLVSHLEKEFPVYLGAAAELSEVNDGLEVKSGENKVVVDKVLVSMGRRPSIKNLGLENLGVELNKHGLPKVNPNTMQVEDLPVFFAGDANGMKPLLHEAVDDGFIAGFNAVGDEVKSFERRTPLAIVFSDPEVAVVGKRFSELDPDKIAVGQSNFNKDLRGVMAARNKGIIRLYADKNSGVLLGAELCGPAGENLGHELAITIDRKMTCWDMLGLPFYHPVYEETLRSAVHGLHKKLSTKRTPALKFS